MTCACAPCLQVVAQSVEGVQLAALEEQAVQEGSEEGGTEEAEEAEQVGVEAEQVDNRGRTGGQ